MYRFLKILLYIPLSILLPTRIIGKKKIDKKGKLILAFNHYSMLDVIILSLHIRRTIIYVAKKELYKNKFLKWFFNVLNVIPIDRNNFDLSTTKKIFKILKEQKVLGIFPEGTRNKTNEIMLEFKEGVTLFAEKTSTPVIPIVLVRKPKFFRLNKVIVGEKMYFENGNKSNAEILRNKMIEMKESVNKEIVKNERNDSGND